MVKYKLRGLHFNARFIPFIDFVTTVHFFLSSKDCQPGSLNATLAAGKIILCLSESDQQDILSASITVQKAGGVGLIYAQSTTRAFLQGTEMAGVCFLWH